VARKIKYKKYAGLATKKGISPKNKARINFKKGGAGNAKDTKNRAMLNVQNP
jgi:hypothetical protein